ncbi:MAG: TMEM175 family protein [Candidatus Nanopelagicales bacterium]
MAQATDDPWTQSTYPRGSAAFDRVIFFSDAVFAIALTLVAVEIGVPEIEDVGSPGELWTALLAKWPTLLAYAFTFFWIAFYWRANHRFTNALSGMNGRYIAAVLAYLAFVALLPFPAATLGEYSSNPVALAFFAVFAATISALEVVLFVVADRAGLFVRPVTQAQRRNAILASLAPVAAFLVSVPLAFVSVWLAVASWLVLAAALGWLVNRRIAPATW